MNSDVKKNCKRKRHTAEMMLPNVKWIMTKSNTYDIGFSTNEMTSVLLCYMYLYWRVMLIENFTSLLPSGAKFCIVRWCVDFDYYSLHI